MTDEPQIDWEHLELDYRAGVLSLRYLAAKYGCSLGAITRRAKRDGWRRILVEQVGTKVTRENSPREHLTGENTQPARENTGRERPEAATTGENGAGENTQKENTRENTRENTSSPVDRGLEASENKKENRKENTKTGCSIGADPEREQLRPNDVLQLGMEYREAQRRYGIHIAQCRRTACGARCPQCLELTTQREVALHRFNHAQYLS